MSGCSGKPVSRDFIVHCGKLPYLSLRFCVVLESKKVCLALQNSPILLGGCRVLRYVRGSGLLQEDPPRWDGIAKVWML
jgi:hypothetical protein